MARERVQIFLDQSNFYNGLRAQFGVGRVDFRKLVSRVLGQRELVALNVYTGLINADLEPEKSAGQLRYLRALEALPFPVNIYARPLRYFASWPSTPPQEKGVDTRIVQDLIVGAVDREYDVACLLTGDQDFVDVVNLLQARFKVRLETYYPQSRRHLYDAARHAFAHAELINRTFFEQLQ